MNTALGNALRLQSDRYVLERQLGAGAHASVWLARDTVLERTVAIKVLAEGLVADRAWLTRFRREARIAARLQHPNLVPVYDLDADAERPYLVMAYVPGGSLQNRIDAGGCPDVERLARDLLGALAHIHSAGIIHRDVKPANVLFERDGRACLTDFGVARPQDATSITQTGQIPGTARYMAPELWRGAPASEQSDLYACGVLLNECLRDDGSPAIVGLIRRLTAEDPAWRPASATAALQDLADEPVTATLETAVHAAPPPLPPSPQPEQTRARRLAVLAVCAVLAIAGILLASTSGDDDQPGSAQRAKSDTGGAEKGSNDEQAAAGDDAPAAAGNESEAPETDLDPAALNDQGFDLINEGRYDEAIPVLQQAVDLADPATLTYAYALYNLGHALRLAGRPEEAIPILEERLEIPNQTDVVAAELEAAREAAGVDSGGEEPGNGEGKAKGHSKQG